MSVRIGFRPAPLVLASGYFFAAAINILALLTLPGVFSPTGLLGASLETSLWLALSGFTAYPVAVIIYAAMKKEPRAPHCAALREP